MIEFKFKVNQIDDLFFQYDNRPFSKRQINQEIVDSIWQQMDDIFFINKIKKKKLKFSSCILNFEITDDYSNLSKEEEIIYSIKNYFTIRRQIFSQKLKSGTFVIIYLLLVPTILFSIYTYLTLSNIITRDFLKEVITIAIWVLVWKLCEIIFINSLLYLRKHKVYKLLANATIKIKFSNKE